LEGRKEGNEFTATRRRVRCSDATVKRTAIAASVGCCLLRI
jgi:hypothetical protein